MPGRLQRYALAALDKREAASGHAHRVSSIRLEAMPSTDSASLAVSLAQTAATLPIASDPTFRGLPFRVRSAYTFRLDSVDVMHLNNGASERKKLTKGSSIFSSLAKDQQRKNPTIYCRLL